MALNFLRVMKKYLRQKSTWPTKPRVLTFRPFGEKVCQPLAGEVQPQPSSKCMKLLDTMSHPRHAGSNHKEIPLHTPQAAAAKKTGDTKGRRGHGKTGILVHCWWERKLAEHHGKSLAVA